MDVNDALHTLKHLPYEDIGIAKVDHHRELRHGIPEVIFAGGKELNDVTVIADSMLKKTRKLLITKASKAVYGHVSKVCKNHKVKVKYFEKSGIIMAGAPVRKKGSVAVLCAGTSDMPVAEEAYCHSFFSWQQG